MPRLSYHLIVLSCLAAFVSCTKAGEGGEEGSICFNVDFSKSNSVVEYFDSFCSSAYFVSDGTPYYTDRLFVRNSHGDFVPQGSRINWPAQKLNIYAWYPSQDLDEIGVSVDRNYLIFDSVGVAGKRSDVLCASARNVDYSSCESGRLGLTFRHIFNVLDFVSGKQLKEGTKILGISLVNVYNSGRFEMHNGSYQMDTLSSTIVHGNTDLDFVASSENVGESICPDLFYIPMQASYLGDGPQRLSIRWQDPNGNISTTTKPLEHVGFFGDWGFKYTIAINSDGSVYTSAKDLLVSDGGTMIKLPADFSISE